MVKSIFILTGLLFSLTQPLVTEQSNFKLENKEVYYERIFEVENKTPDELVKSIEGYLKNDLKVENVITDKNIIRAQHFRTPINYSMYSEKSTGVWRILNCPTESNITIIVTPNKYKLLITDIEFSCGLPQPYVYKLNKESTKQGTEFKKSKVTKDGMNYLDKYFTDKFNIATK